MRARGHTYTRCRRRRLWRARAQRAVQRSIPGRRGLAQRLPACEAGRQPADWLCAGLPARRCRRTVVRHCGLQCNRCGSCSAERHRTHEWPDCRQWRRRDVNLRRRRTGQWRCRRERRQQGWQQQPAVGPVWWPDHVGRNLWPPGRQPWQRVGQRQHPGGCGRGRRRWRRQHQPGCSQRRWRRWRYWQGRQRQHRFCVRCRLWPHTAIGQQWLQQQQQRWRQRPERERQQPSKCSDVGSGDSGHEWQQRGRHGCHRCCLGHRARRPGGAGEHQRQRTGGRYTCRLQCQRHSAGHCSIRCGLVHRSRLPHCCQELQRPGQFQPDRQGRERQRGAGPLGTGAQHATCSRRQ